MMLHHNGLHNGLHDVTRNMTHGLKNETYRGQEKTSGSQHHVMGEISYARDGAANKRYYNDRHSTDVDDGVNSSDGDYDPAAYSKSRGSQMVLASVMSIGTPPPTDLEALETVDDSANASARSVTKDKSLETRLSHAESTDSGMGFSDNSKDNDASRLSAGDGYGTIHLINPPPLEEHENRKSLLDGDAEYDEVIEFVTQRTEGESKDSQNLPDFSTFKTPTKTGETDAIKSPGDSASKYAELDFAKILHTRRRHRHASTLGRRLTEEEKQPDENNGFNSLRRKSKAKNHAISSYGTYGRNRKPCKQSSTESYGSRPSSTYTDDVDPMQMRSDSIGSGAFRRKTSKSSIVENTFGHYNTLKPRRNNYSSDLMMTTDLHCDVMNTSDTTWSESQNRSLASEVDDYAADVTGGSNRWSWLSNSSQTQSFSNEKTQSSSKSPWKIFRRLLGGGDKRKPADDDASPSPSASSQRPRSTSLFRRFSMRRSHKNSLGKRRNSVPAKSEWDVQNSVSTSPDFGRHVPVIDAGKSGQQKTRGRLSTRLRSFRGGKNRGSKKHNAAMSKGLSISSPQLSVHAIDPTRNYSEHQLLDLDNLSIRDSRK